MRIEISPSGRRHCLCFYRDGDGGVLFHTDTINIHDDHKRQRLISSLVEHHGIDRAVAEDRMLAVTREVVAQEQRQREGADEPGVDRWRNHPTVHNQVVPGGELIGFVQGDDVYWDPQASFAAAQCLAREGGDAA